MQCPICGAADGECQSHLLADRPSLIRTPEDTMPAFQSNRRLYLTADKSRVVEEGDPQARSLLVRAGGNVSAELAERYGLSAPKTTRAEAKAEEPKAEPAPETEPEATEEPEAKAVPGPSENKARRVPAEK